MLKFTERILEEVNDKLSKDNKLFDNDEVTEFGKYVLPLVVPQIAKFVIVKAFAPDVEANYDKKTGDVIFTNKDGTITYKTKMNTKKSTQMAQTDNPHDLVSINQHRMELIYADYASSMKALANKARLDLYNTKKLQYNPQAAKIYAKEVSSLNSKLNEALKNSIKERHANRLTAAEMKERKKLNPNMTKEEEKKINQRVISKYREQLGSVPRRKRNIGITDKEWEAIQAGAISNNKLKQILNNSDPEELRQRSMPKDKPTVSTAMISRMKSMKDSGFTLKEIADKFGVSTSTVSEKIKE
jgi:predicted DNA binding protein